MVGDFQLRFDDAAAFQRAWEDSLFRGEAFVATSESPLLGSTVRVRIAVPSVGDETLEAEVLSLEVDEHDRPGMRVSFGDSSREQLRQLAAKLPARVEDTRRRVPLAPTSPIPRLDGPGELAPTPPGGLPAPAPPALPSHSPFKAGQVLGGRFQVEALIGEGGMGEVYRATHVYLKRPVALKTLQKKLLTDQEAWTRFQREAELVSQLESPHVVRVFDFGRLDDGQPFICMEFVEGQSLGDVLDQGPMEPGDAVTLLEQVGEGLAEAHALGIVHRDLKPPNIMLGKRRDGRTQAKILDFGIARIAGAQTLDRITATGMVVGTPAYLAPEQAMGGDIDARTDIYALGCVAYGMLTGRPPFRADAIGQLLMMHLNEKPRPLHAFRPQLSGLPALSDAVLKALEKEPGRRWQAVGDFTAALRAGLSNKPRPAPRPSAPQPDDPTDSFPVENLPVITAPSHLEEEPPEVNSTMAGVAPADVEGWDAEPAPDPRRSAPSGMRASTPRPSAPSGPGAPPPRPSGASGLRPAFQPSSASGASGLRPAYQPPSASGASGLRPALQPRSSAPLPPRSAPLPPRASAPLPPPPRMTPPPYGAVDRSDALDGRLGRLGETLANLNFALSPERVAAMETARASISEATAIGWVLVAEPMRTTYTQPAYVALLGLAADVVLDWGGALDQVDQKLFTFLFTGSGAQARAVLAAQELRERIEAMLDGAPADAPSFRLALNGGRVTPPHDGPLTGDVVNAARELAGKAGPGQVLLPPSFANAVSDLVDTQPAGDGVAIVDRKPFPARPLPVVGRELTVAALAERLATLAQGASPPLVVVGARQAGRSAMAQEAITRARAQGFVVGHAQGSPGLAGIPFAALADVVCQLCGVVPSQRFTTLAPVLERLPLSPGEREAVLLLTQVKTPLAPFTPKQAVHVLRRVLEAGAGDRKQVLVFDALEGCDDASAEAVRELGVAKTSKTLVLCFTTPEHADQWFSDFHQAPLPPLSQADVARWLAAFLGHAAPRELQVGLEARARGLPGLLCDWALLAAERGLLRPRGSGLALEGVLPAVEPEALAAERLKAVGARVARLVEATAALGDAADTAVLGRVLPGLGASTWQRLQATKLVVSLGGTRVKVVSRAVEDAAQRGPTARRAALWQRLIAALGETVKKAPMEWLRLARLVATVADPARAAQAWRTAAEQALALKSPLGLMHALSGWADAVAAHPGSDSADATRLRLELLARAAANAFVVRDSERARALVEAANDLAQRDQVGVPEHFLVASRLHRSLGRPELAQEALSQALVLAGQGPVLGLLLAEVGDVKESEGDLPSAVQAYEQAVPRCDAAAPLAAWHGELDFRARVETRLAGVLMAMKDPDAKLLLGSSLQRWRAAGAPQYEARVLANLGALAVAEGKLADAATLFTQAAATAEGAGDFVFEARQLVSLAKVQARAGQAEARQTAEAARRRAAAVGWDEGVKAASALLKAE